MQKSIIARVILILVLICGIGLLGLQTYANVYLTKTQMTQVQLPQYFEPAQWAEDGWIYGTMGNKFLRFNPETNGWKLLIPHVWSGRVAPNGQLVAFVDENGLQYVNVANGSGIHVIDNQSDLRIHLWSPDSTQILYSQAGEWSSNYFLYDFKTGQSQPYIFKNVQNFLSEPLYWRKDQGVDQIIFSLRFNRSRTGEQEYRSGGYRSELYLANLEGEFTPLVEVKDGEYLLTDGISAASDQIFYHYFGKSEEMFIYDLTNGQVNLSWNFEQVKKVSLAPEVNLGFLERDRLELIDLKRNETIHTFSFEYKRVIWSPDRSKVLVYPSRESAVTTGYLIQLQQQ